MSNKKGTRAVLASDNEIAQLYAEILILMFDIDAMTNKTGVRKDFVLPTEAGITLCLERVTRKIRGEKKAPIKNFFFRRQNLRVLPLIRKIQHWLPSILIRTISVRIRERGRERGGIAKTAKIGSVTLTDLRAGNSKSSNIKVIKYSDLQCRPKVKQLSKYKSCLLYTSPSPRDLSTSRMPSSA